MLTTAEENIFSKVSYMWGMRKKFVLNLNQQEKLSALPVIKKHC